MATLEFYQAYKQIIQQLEDTNWTIVDVGDPITSFSQFEARNESQTYRSHFNLFAKGIPNQSVMVHFVDGPVLTVSRLKRLCQTLQDFGVINCMVVCRRISAFAKCALGHIKDLKIAVFRQSTLAQTYTNAHQSRKATKPIQSHNPTNEPKTDTQLMPPPPSTLRGRRRTIKQSQTCNTHTPKTVPKSHKNTPQMTHIQLMPPPTRSLRQNLKYQTTNTHTPPTTVQKTAETHTNPKLSESTQYKSSQSSKYYSPIPKNYKCGSCNAIGQHWIMECSFLECYQNIKFAAIKVVKSIQKSKGRDSIEAGVNELCNALIPLNNVRICKASILLRMALSNISNAIDFLRTKKIVITNLCNAKKLIEQSI